MKDIQKRVVKLEGLLGLRDEPETSDDMIATFEKGGYGYNSVMGIVVAILYARNGESLKKDLPAELVEFFVETLKRTPSYEGHRERREGESEKDYLAYKILECAAVAGYPELETAEKPTIYDQI
jgi:hypothetical protein